MPDLIRMTSVEYGRNNNHLIFKGFIPRKDPNWQYEFDFIGVETNINTYLPEKAKEQLTNKLAEEYGYAPYDIKKVKEIFGDGRDYKVDSVVGI